MRPIQRSLAALLSILALLLTSPSTARADIKVRVRVRLISGERCRVSSASGTDRSCTVTVPNSPNNDYFETKLEGNVIEQAIDAFQFYQAVDAFIADVGEAIGSAGAASALAGAKAANDAREAYNEFKELLDGWGGKSKDTRDVYFITNPNKDYRWVEVTLIAESDDDPFERAVVAPSVSYPGVTIETLRNESKAKTYKVVVDLTALPSTKEFRIPVGLAVGEGDCSFSCLKLSKVLDLVVERPEEGNVVANTSITFSSRDASCDVCGFLRRDVVMHNRYNPTQFVGDEPIQNTTISMKQGRTGEFYVWNNNSWKQYESLDIGIDIDSPRLQQGGRPIVLNADCLRQCPAGFVRQVRPVSSYLDSAGNRTEGRGSAYFTIRPADVPLGETVLVFNANYETGGGSIAQHVVKIVRDTAFVIHRKGRDMAPSTRTADGNPAAPSGAPANTIAPGRIVVAHPLVANIAGNWSSNIGLRYEITQKGDAFRWTVESRFQTATGTIQGSAVQASWKEGTLTGSARGTVRLDANGKPARIEWDNGVVFTRIP